MPLQYYICALVGSGAPDDLRRPAIADVATRWTSVIGMTPNGLPVRPWAVVLADVPVGATLPAGTIALGSILDIPFRQLPAGLRTALQSYLTAENIAVSPATTLRQVLEQLCAVLVPGARPDMLFVRE